MPGRLAQLEERRPYKAEVAGPRPAAPTTSIVVIGKNGLAGRQQLSGQCRKGGGELSIGANLKYIDY